jgi:hypothetical protein
MIDDHNIFSMPMQLVYHLDHDSMHPYMVVNAVHICCFLSKPSNYWQICDETYCLIVSIGTDSNVDNRFLSRSSSFDDGGYW